MVVKEDKENLKIKPITVMICMPTKGEMKTKTCDKLIRLFVYCANHGIKTTITFAEGTLVSAVRSVLVKQFLESSYDYLFFIDSDMTFNEDIIIRLLGLNKNIACGIAKVRGNKSYNVYHYVPEKEQYAPIGEIKNNAVIEVDATGCSCVLIHRRVFEDIIKRKRELREMFKKMNSEEKDEFRKTYFWNMGKDEAVFVAMGEKSEDILFYELARSCGYKIYCDLGIRCGHIVETELEP